MADLQGWIAVGEIQGGPAPEEILPQAGRAGDRAALERLVTLYKHPLFVLCYGILGHVDDAEDAVQETILRALRALPRFRGDATFRTWIYRIAVNVCLNWKRDCRPCEPWDETQLRISLAVDSPETIALRRLRLLEALKTLRPHHRAVFLLKEREGWNVAEIAVAFGWSHKRVENELYRARRALVDWRQRNADEGNEP